MDRDRELGKLKRYTDLMQGDVKNALWTVLNLKPDENSNLGSIQHSLEEIEKHILSVQENLKSCASQQEN